MRWALRLLQVFADFSLGLRMTAESEVNFSVTAHFGGPYSFSLYHLTVLNAEKSANVNLTLREEWKLLNLLNKLLQTVYLTTTYLERFYFYSSVIVILLSWLLQSYHW